MTENRLKLKKKTYTQVRTFRGRQIKIKKKIEKTRHNKMYKKNDKKNARKI